MEFRGTLDGAEVRDIFRVSLEIEPEVKSIYVSKRVPSTDGLYNDVYFTVRYTGGDYVFYSVEQEQVASLDTHEIEEPYLAHGVARHLISSLRTWITVTVRNAHGSASLKIEVPPLSTDEAAFATAGISAVPDYNETTEAEVFGLSGAKLGTIAVKDVDLLPRGAYILRIKRENGSITNLKYFSK